MTRSLTALALTLTLLLLVASPLRSATFVVDTEADSHDINPGDGITADSDNPLTAHVSLRAAIEESNSLPGQDTIQIVGDTMQINLSLGTLYLTDNGTFIAGEDGWPTIDGAGLEYGSVLMEIVSDSNEIVGLTFKRSRSHALLIKGKNNLIGGTVNGARNRFLGCGLDYNNGFAIAISGAEAVGNSVRANWIGLEGNGTEVNGNRNGILISDSASNNVIGNDLLNSSCFVSGSAGWGIVIRNGAYENVVKGSAIGIDLTWMGGPGNMAGGLLIDNAERNRIGGDSYASRNLVADNKGWGIMICGPEARENEILGNFIGCDSSGLISIANEGGLLLTDRARFNVIGFEDSLPSNVISGNAGDGIRIEGTGTDNNFVLGNYLGPSSRGGGLYAGDTYSENGVVITDGARYNRIGSPAPAGGNVISLNRFAGVLITGAGSSENRLIGNFLGVSGAAISSAPNGSGVVIRDGASNNFIGGYTEEERNIISGNRAEVFPWGGGVVIYDPGSSGNVVVGNYIGTDYDGARALRNGSSGVIIGNGASYNLIGGDQTGAGNLISGNGSEHTIRSLARGVSIMGSETAHNRIEGNLIGPKADRSGYLANWGDGVGIFDGAHDNRIGGDSELSGNLIVGNEGCGILSEGPSTDRNLFRNNMIGANDSVAIRLSDGANGMISPPVIQTATPLAIIGYAQDAGITIDIYRHWSPSLTGDLSVNLVGSSVTAGDHSFVLNSPDVAPGDSVWGIATSPDSASSAFSEIVMVEVATDIAETEDLLPIEFSLAQNYPNPFNPITTIKFSLPRPEHTVLTIYNLIGQQVAQPVDRIFPAGEHSLVWNGKDGNDNELASGVYFYQLQAGNWSASHAAILLK